MPQDEELVPQPQPADQPSPSSPIAVTPEVPAAVSKIPDMREALEALRQAGMESFRKELTQAGGGATWCRRTCPRVHAAVTAMTNALTDAHVESETRAFWTGAEARMGECARCPEAGGACHDSPERILPGLQVTLTLGPPPDLTAIGIDVPCEKYSDYRMAKRLEAFGVDARFSHLKLQTISREPKEHVIRAFDRVLEAAEGKVAPVGVSLLIEGQYSRAYGVALLRTIARNCPSASMRAAHVSSLIRECKEAMRMKSSPPLQELLDYDVLLLDGADAELTGEKKRESSTGARARCAGSISAGVTTSRRRS